MVQGAGGCYGNVWPLCMHTRHGASCYAPLRGHVAEPTTEFREGQVHGRSCVSNCHSWLSLNFLESCTGKLQRATFGPRWATRKQARQHPAPSRSCTSLASRSSHSTILSFTFITTNSLSRVVAAHAYVQRLVVVLFSSSWYTLQDSPPSPSPPRTIIFRTLQSSSVAGSCLLFARLMIRRGTEEKGGRLALNTKRRKCVV